MYGHITSTPVPVERRLQRSGRYGRDLVFRDLRFEFQPTSICAANSVPLLRSFFVNHRGQVFHERADLTLEQSTDNPMDGRPGHAVLADGRERLLVLAQDMGAANEWVIMASIDVRNGEIQEGTLSAPVSSTVADLMTRCGRLTNVGAR